MKKIAIIGAGLSGLTMAYNIKQNCEADIVIFEKGNRYVDRIETDGKDLVCGVGGAGTLFGGKLCFPPASSGMWIRSGLKYRDFEDFEKKCLNPFILDKNIPYDVFATEVYLKNESLFMKEYASVFLNKTEMRRFVKNLIDVVSESGVIIYNNCEFRDYKEKDGKFYARCLFDGIVEETHEFDYLIFASGRLSSGSTAKWLGDRIPVAWQNPDLGIRFSMKYNDYGTFKNIGQDVKIKAKFGDIGVRTFCVCSGGNKTVVDLNGIQYYDGHFEETITDEINLGVLARSPYIFGYEAAALYCSYLNAYMSLDLSLKDFINYSDRLIKETNIFADIIDSIKYFVNLLIQEHVIDDNLDKYPVWLPSIDRLNPIVQTNHNFETKTRNLYVIGDAVGISRGFVQSMWSAYCASEDVVMKLKTQAYMEKIII